MSSRDFDLRPIRHKGEKLDDIVVPEANAAMTRRLADETFLIRPVDIDITLARVVISLLNTIKPENAGQNTITLPSRFGNFPSGQPTLENRPRRCLRADFFADPEFPERSFETSRFGSQTKF